MYPSNMSSYHYTATVCCDSNTSMGVCLQTVGFLCYFRQLLTFYHQTQPINDLRCKNNFPHLHVKTTIWNVCY